MNSICKSSICGASSLYTVSQFSQTAHKQAKRQTTWYTGHTDTCAGKKVAKVEGVYML